MVRVVEVSSSDWLSVTFMVVVDLVEVVVGGGGPVSVNVASVDCEIVLVNIMVVLGSTILVEDVDASLGWGGPVTVVVLVLNVTALSKSVEEPFDELLVVTNRV